MRKIILIKSSKNGKRHLCVDEINSKSIYAYINSDERHKKKFRYISEIAIEGLRNTNVYDKEELNSKCKGVTAMKFFKGQENDRIYCKEISTTKGVFVIIAAGILRRKKQTKLSQREKSIIERIASYEYEIPEFRRDPKSI